MDSAHYLMRRYPIFLQSTLSFLALTPFTWWRSPTPRAASNVMLASGLAFAVLLLWRSQSETSRAESERSLVGKWPGVLIPMGVAVLVWSPTLTHFFVSDEFVHFYTGRQPLASLLSSMFFRGESSSFIRPVGFLTFWIDSHVWGDWIPGYHITNVALHVANVGGVFVLCRQAESLRPLAFPAALVFGILPVQTESVAWVGARFDLVSCLLVLWSATCYLRFRQNGRERFYVLALSFALLAFFGKENAYIIPVLLVAIECCLTPSRSLRPVVPFLLMILGIVGYRVWVLGGLGGYLGPDGESETLRFGLDTLEGLVVRAPSLTLLGLNWLQPGLAGLIGAALAGLFLAIAWAGRAKRAVVAFALVWLIAAALPAHPLLLIGPSLTNARVLYLGSVGLAIGIASALCASSTRAGATVALVALLIAGARHNTAAWQHTSGLARQFLEDVERQVPAPAEGTQFVFYGVPEYVRGVHFLRVSMTAPLWLAYGRTDIEGTRAEEGANREAPVVELDWTGGPGSLVGLR